MLARPRPAITRPATHGMLIGLLSLSAETGPALSGMTVEQHFRQSAQAQSWEMGVPR